MAASFAATVSPSRTEDVLECLPISRIAEYRKGEPIYGYENRSSSVYLVVSGKVEISQMAQDGSEVLLEIVRCDELFGESAFLDVALRSERAVAVEGTELMSWAITEVEGLVMKRPRLAVALLQVLAQHNAEFTCRIASFATDTIEQRLARALLRFAKRLGTVEEDGTERMMPLTHALLSRHVGTSREIVTQYMNRFKKRGYVSYSRLGIVIHRESLETVLDHTATTQSAAAGS
jgi:CRP/FNR family transcriptional regulator, cyclic AMP receptor protein